jgi:hypothetical protein
VVLHASGTPNPTIATTDQTRCLSFSDAEARGLDITALREDYTVAVEAFPDHKPELAEGWSELQYTLRDRLQETGENDFGGRSMFSIVLFEPDGRIAWVFNRGLEPDEERLFCEVVEKLSEEYRFPLESSTRFSQCGTTHFKENEELGIPTPSPR